MNIVLCGEHRVIKRRRGEARPFYVSGWTPNAITGKDRFWRSVLGLDPVFGAASKLVIQDATPAIIKTLSGTVNATPEWDGSGVVWQWEDVSEDEYTVATVQVLSGADLELSDAAPSYSGGNTKPANEIWTYQYRLTLGAGTGPFTPGPTVTTSEHDGLSRVIRSVAGIDAALGLAQWWLMPFSVDGSPADPEGAETLLDTLPNAAHDVTGGVLTISWQVDAGVATGDWDWLLIRVGPTVYLIDRWPNTDGAKPAHEQWDYDLVIEV